MGSPPADASIAIPAAEAWGDFETVRLPIPIGTDRHFVFDFTATPDGRYLIGVSQPNAFVAATQVFKDPSYAVLYEVATGRLMQMARLTALRSQMLSAASDGRWVVWFEADDEPYFYHWRLRAYDLATGEVRELAEAVEHDGQPIEGPLSFVTASNGLAVWGQAIGTGAQPGQMANAVVRQADLATGKITTLAHSAGFPWLSWPWVSWGVFATGTFDLHLRNLETGQTRVLDITPAEFVLDGASAAYNDGQSLSMWLIDDVAGSAPAVEIARGADLTDHLEWPSLNDRIVGWAQSLSTTVYDRAARRLVSIDAPFAQVAVSGRLMAWAVDDPGTSPARGWDDWLIVVNTDTLPILP